MTSLAKLQAREFYASFARLFDYLRNQPEHRKHLDKMLQDSGSWTKFMLHELLPEVIKDVGNERLKYQHEFKHIDLCAWHNTDEEWDQAIHGLPLYVQLAIEHENGPHPQQEFWKLLYLYAPLKILICYCHSPQHSKWPQRDELLKWLKEMHDRACAFHPRSADDAYLVIVGQLDVATSAELAWQGYEVKTGWQGFVQIS